MKCEDCDEREAEEGEDLCETCRDNNNERAYERQLSDYYGGDGPQTLDEQCYAAWKIKRGLD